MALLVPLIAMLATPVVSHAESTNPTPTREYVVDDYAQILDDTTKQMVINQEKQYQKTETHPQIVLMTVKSTNDENIDNFSDDVLEHARWKIGKKGLDNGVLILFAQNNGNNNVRISTGYGVEDILPDATTNQILQDNKGLLKSSNPEDVNMGLRNVFQRVSTVINKRYLKMSLNEARKKQQTNKNKNTMMGLLLGIIAVIVGIGVVIFLIFHNNDDDNHHGGPGGGRRDSSDGFWLGALAGSLIGSSGSRDNSFGGFGDSGGFGDAGGFGSSGGGGDFGGGGSSI